MSTLTIERMAVEVDGSGPAVVCIHGLGGTSNTWTPLAAALAGRHRVVRPDLPGSGRSPLPGEAPSIAGFADAVTRLCGVLGIERAIFLGHSLGGIVCQHLAVARPSLVRGLALFGPMPAPPDGARQGLRDRAAAARRDGMADIADAVVEASTAGATRADAPVTVALVREMVMRQPPDGYAATCEALASAEAADAGRIAAPTLLMTGDEDAVAPPSVLRAMAAAMPDATPVIVPRCGHWTPFEAAGAVGRELAAFLDRVR